MIMIMLWFFSSSLGLMSYRCHDNVSSCCQYYPFWDSDTYNNTAGLATGKNYTLASGMKAFAEKEEPYKVRCQELERGPKNDQRKT